jgi:hypothetical protein
MVNFSVSQDKSTFIVVLDYCFLHEGVVGVESHVWHFWTLSDFLIFNHCVASACKLYILRLILLILILREELDFRFYFHR